jgi:hypothetical protein
LRAFAKRHGEIFDKERPVEIDQLLPKQHA